MTFCRLLRYIRGAHASYSQALEENRKMQSDGEKRKQEWQRHTNELKNAKEAKTESMISL